MQKLEIHRLALLAAAKITFVVGATACQGERPGAIRREPVAPSTRLVTQAAPAADPEASACETAAAAADPRPASAPAPAPAPSPVDAEAARKAPTAAARPARALPGLGGSKACAAGARAAQQSGVAPPAIVACCNAIVASDPSTSGIDWSDAMACCGVPGVDPRGKAFCTPWGPPAPPAMPAGWLS